MNPKNEILNRFYPDNQVKASKTEEDIMYAHFWQYISLQIIRSFSNQYMVIC